MDERIQNSMKLVKDYKSRFVETNYRGGNCQAVSEKTGDSPEKVDLRYKVCVDSNGLIDCVGALRLHYDAISTDGNDSDSSITKSESDCEALIAAEYDVIRKGTLDVIERVTGLSMVTVAASYVEPSPTSTTPFMPAWMANDVERVMEKPDIYFGIHCLLARATHAAVTCSAKWPDNPFLALRNQFIDSVVAHSTDALAWQIANDAGIMWDFLTPSALLAIAGAIGEHPSELSSLFDEGQTSLLYNNMVTVHAMNCETLIAIMNYQLRGIAETLSLKPNPAIENVKMSIEKMRAHLEDTHPSIYVLVGVWQEIGCLLSCLEGYLVGAGERVGNLSCSSAIDEASEAYAVGFDCGSTALCAENASTTPATMDFCELACRMIASIVCTDN